MELDDGYLNGRPVRQIIYVTGWLFLNSSSFPIPVLASSSDDSYSPLA
jgi:hypothetical protein